MRTNSGKRSLLARPITKSMRPKMVNRRPFFFAYDRQTDPPIAKHLAYDKEEHRVERKAQHRNTADDPADHRVLWEDQLGGGCA
jgi:hypothetical protein